MRRIMEALTRLPRSHPAVVNSRQRLRVVIHRSRTARAPFEYTLMNNGKNHNGGQWSEYPENRDHLRSQGQSDQNQGHATERQVRYAKAAMLTFVYGVCGFPGVKPSSIFRSWLVALS